MGRILAYYCTPLVREKTLLRAEGPERGMENVLLLDKYLFSFQLQFGIRLKISVFRLIA